MSEIVSDHSPPPKPPRGPDPLFGKVIADRYRIVGQVGRGGMGVVYKVEHLRIGKLMAMKLLTGELSRNREVVRRFKREALAVSRLTSVNTVQVWDFGHTEGLTYLVMELVEGDDFGKLLKSKGPLPFERVAKIAVQVCNSLIEAHARGIVHRDLKPENLMLVRTGSSELQDLVKVLDFGLAKLHEDDARVHANANANEITITGAIVGTPHYMAPEQIRGEPVDGRTDVYALGAVMYRALTGEPPFVAPNPMAVLTAHLTEELTPPDVRAPKLGIPQEASEIIGVAMAKDPAERFPSAAALREVLIAHLARAGVSGGFLRSGSLEAVAAQGTADVAHAESRPPTTQPFGRAATRSEVDAYARKMRRNATVASMVAIALVGAAAWLVSGWRQNVATQRRAAHEEIEPNNDTTTATRLSLGTPFKGEIGKRIAPDAGDVDVYSIDVPMTGSESPLLEIELGALPNIPLCLSLIDGDDAPPLGKFCRPRGESLRIDAWAIAPGRHFLRVEQDRSGGEPVYENVSDSYSLRVPLAARKADLEIEPNDESARPQVLGVGSSIAGKIGWNGDRDVYCNAHGDGRARFVVVDRRTGAHASEAPIEVQTFVDGATGPKTTLGAASASLATEGAVGGGPTSDSSFVGATFDAAARHACIAVALAPPRAPTGCATSAHDGDAAYGVTLESQ